MVSKLPDVGSSLARVVSVPATLVSVVASRGQFRWQAWSVAVAKVVS